MQPNPRARETHQEHDKFDFVWHNSNGRYVAQVKSCQNDFSKSAVLAWATAMPDTPGAASAKLILIGNCPSGIPDTAENGI